MDRRSFLVKSSFFLAGSVLGLNGFSKALAYGEQNNKFPLRPRIALIIDDIGQSISHARRFMKLDCPVTFSILPRLVHSYDLALEIHERGYEIMLHQPMEPWNPEVDPGPGALYVGDETERIEVIMEENISCVPFAAGVNNHMGSKFTACKREISEALRVVEKRGLFFVDSLTSNRSLAYMTAKKFHMPAACRNIFLDNVQSESYVHKQLLKLSRRAQKYGSAIGIGHPFRETANAMRLFLTGVEPSGISFVPVSEILHT